METRLQRHYLDHVRPALKEEFGWSNPHQIPKVLKVVLNVGLGEASRNQKLLDSVLEELATVTGQKPVVTRAKKSISNFGLREGVPTGAMVTLRQQRMYEFLDRLISVAIPRIRDFRGMPVKFDGRGNYTMGVKEQVIFPEIEYDKVGTMHGMNITIVTNTEKDDEAFALLREMGFPFKGEVPVQVGAA